MQTDTVKARKVAGSMVVTLTAKLLETLQIEEGDEMRLETVGDSAVLVRKANDFKSSPLRLRLELDVLEKEEDYTHKDADFHQMYYNGSASGYDDQLIAWQAADVRLAKAALAVAQKRLELFDLTGETDVERALATLEGKAPTAGA